ncbi:beta strand repeat-containing protein [Spirosoma areae]
MTVNNPVAGQTLTVNDGTSTLTFSTSAGTSNTFTATFNNLPSDNTTRTITVSLPGCGSATTTYTAPVSCLVTPVCSISATASAGLCQTATNTYSSAVTITVFNPVGGQTLSVTDGGITQTFSTTTGSSNTFTAVFNSLLSDGSAHLVNISLPGCGATTATYMAPTSCSIAPVCSVGTPVVTAGVCNSVTNSFSSTVVVTVNNPTGGSTLTISDGASSQPFTTTAGSSNTFTAVFAGLVSNGATRTVTVSLPGCGSATASYTAPVSCTPTLVCQVQTPTITVGPCLTATNTYSTTAVVTVQNPAGGATLTISNGITSQPFTTTAGASNTFTMVFTGLVSNGASQTITASLPGCGSATATYTAPASCSVAAVCSVGTPVVTVGPCLTATNTYSTTAVVTLTNPTAGVLTVSISNGVSSLTTAVPGGLSIFTYTAVFNGLLSDALTRTVTATLPGCGSATAQYTAPASCSVAPVCSVATPVVTVGVCNSATNAYSTTAVVTLTNTTAGVLTVSNGGQSLTTTVAGGLSSFTYTATFNGLVSDGSSQSIKASLPGCGSATASYTAPVSCTPTLVCQVQTPTITVGPCLTATNTYSTTAVVTVQNPAGGATLTISNGITSQPFTTTAGSSNTFTMVFNGVLSDGLTRPITATLPGCGSATAQYTAPVSCSAPAPVFDLALIKTLAAGQAASVTPGSSVTFTVTVFNQGNVTATNINLVDNIPAGLTLNDANWLLSGSTAILNTPIASLSAGASTTRTIIFTVNAGVSGAIVNRAEISSAQGGTDTDSTPDNNGTNDAGGTPNSGSDDSTGGNGTGTPGDTSGATDEDDADPAVITVTPTPVCSINPVVTVGPCLTATSTYSVTAVVTLANTTAGVLTVSNGANSLTTTVTGGLSSFTYTATFNGLISNGASQSITASLPGCGSAVATYSAPVSCSVAPPVCSISATITAGLCSTVNNTFSTTATVTVLNPSAGTLTVVDGTITRTFTTTAGASNTFTIINAGINSDGSVHTVTASVPGCSSATVTYTAPVSCTAAPVCSVSATVTAGLCASATNTYSATVTATVLNPTGGGTLTISNGAISQPFTTTAGSSNMFTAIFNGLTSDGASHTVTVSLPACGTATPTYTAPASCSVTPACSVGTPVVTVGACNSATNAYSATAVVTLTNTTAGVLTVSNGGQSLTTTVAGGLSSFTYTATFNGLVSDGLTHTITATLPGCGSATATYTAPVSCTPTLVCQVQTPTITAGVCNSATNTYSVTAVVVVQNPTNGGTLTISNGVTSQPFTTTAGSSNTFTMVFTGLTSNGLTRTITATLAGCGSTSATYTAPVSCSVTPVCSIAAPVITVGPCLTATNAYSTTATITLTNPAAGVLTVSNGASSLTTTIGGGLTTFTFTATFNGLTSNGATRTITASLPGCGSATASYTAPASCSATPVCAVGTPVVTVGVCNSATNAYSTTATITLTNPTGGVLTVANGPASLTFSVPALVGTATVSAIFNGLLSDGLTHTITASLPGCGSATASYTAPVSCTPTLVCQVQTPTITAGVCNSATNTYSVTAVVVVQNPTNGGTLTISNGVTSQPFTTTAGSSNTFTMVFTGLTSNGSTNTVTATLAGCGSTSATYTAPVSCTPVVTPVFDLALRKTLAAGQSTAVTPGSSVTFTITVFNQGNVTATAINLVDLIPAGLTLNDANWTAAGNIATLNTPIASLSAGASTTRNIIFTLNAGTSGAIVNRAEISSAQGGTDVDSSPDSTPGNDAGGAPDSGSDDTVIGNGTGTPGSTDPATDEDDSDPAILIVDDISTGLVLEKLVSNSTAQVGNILTYSLVLTNTGSVSATTTVRDSLSSGSTYVANSAVAPAGTSFTPGAPSLWTVPTIAAGQSLTLTFQVRVDSMGVLYNTATIPGDTAKVCTSVPIQVCTGSNYAFVLSAPAGYANYQFYNGSTLVYQGTLNSYTATTPGSYSISVTGVAGCPDGTCCPVIIQEVAPPSFTVVATDPTCVGGQLQTNGQLTISGLAGNPASYTYQYSVGGSFNAATATAVAPVPGNGVLINNLSATQTYTVRVYNGAGCFTDQTVTITAPVCVCPPAKCAPIVITRTRTQRR